MQKILWFLLSSRAANATPTEMLRPWPRDPVETSREKLLNYFKVPEAEIEAINERVRLEVEECVKFAEESPWPSDDELLKDVYAQQDYPFIMD